MYYESAPESIQRAMDVFRKKTEEKWFIISNHAATRMNQRNITEKQVIECIINGNACKGKVIPDSIGGIFFYKNLCVVMYDTYGADHDSKPTVLTVYRDGEEFDVEYGEAPKPVVKVQEVVKYVDRVVVTKPNLDDLSIEELEALLQKKKENTLKKQIDEILGQKQVLINQRSVIDQQVAALDTKLAELGHSGNVMAAPNDNSQKPVVKRRRRTPLTEQELEQFEHAYQNPVYYTAQQRGPRRKDGVNLLQTAKDYGLDYSRFLVWLVREKNDRFPVRQNAA